MCPVKGYNAQVSSQNLGTAIMKLAEDPKTTVCTESFRNGFFYDIQKSTTSYMTTRF